MREIPLEDLETAFRLTLEKAQKAIAGKYFHYARSLLASLLEHYPNCPALRMMLRQTAIVVRDDESSAAWAWTKTALVNIYYALQHSPLNHINSLERILTKRPDCLAAHQALAQAAISKELWGTAALSLESLVTLSPEDSHSKVLLARAYLKLGRVEEAQGIVKGVLDHSPHHDFAQELLKQASVEETLKKDSWRK